MDKTRQRKQLMVCCLAAASPLLLMAGIFNFSLLFKAQYLLWTNQEILGYIIQAEFLAIASGVLIVLPLLIHTQGMLLRIFRILLFTTLAVIFAWLSYDIGGTEGMLFYALLVFINFGGGTLFFFDNFATATRAYLTLLRWSLGIFVYVSLQLYFNLDSDISTWKNTDQVIPFGAAFFYLLFIFELIISPPLTYYLERKNADDSFLSEKIAQPGNKQKVVGDSA